MLNLTFFNSSFLWSSSTSSHVYYSIAGNPHEGPEFSVCWILCSEQALRQPELGLVGSGSTLSLVLALVAVLNCVAARMV